MRQGLSHPYDHLSVTSNSLSLSLNIVVASIYIHLMRSIAGQHNFVACLQDWFVKVAVLASCIRAYGRLFYCVSRSDLLATLFCH